MERITKPGSGVKIEGYIDPLPDILDEQEMDEPLRKALIRWKNILFQYEGSYNYANYMRRVSAFDGYHPGNHHAQGFAYDTIGQMCGTVGQLKATIIRSKQEGRELTLFEIARAKNGFFKAADIRGSSAAYYEQYDNTEENRGVLHLGAVHRSEQKLIITLAENVPTIVCVIDEVDRRNAAIAVQ